MKHGMILLSHKKNGKRPFKKINDMNKQQVWTCIIFKWLLKIKCNGVYHVRLMAANFSDDYSPVVNHIMLWIQMPRVIHFGFSAEIVDVETAFLYENLIWETSMQCTNNSGKDDCVIFNKWICSLVHAMRQLFKKAFKILKKVGFSGVNVDPCLYMKKSAGGIVYIALYIDENLMVGNSKAKYFENMGYYWKSWKGSRIICPV